MLIAPPLTKTIERIKMRKEHPRPQFVRDTWLNLNAELAKLDSFENITEIDESRRPADAAEWKDVPNKIDLLDRGDGNTE